MRVTLVLDPAKLPGFSDAKSAFKGACEVQPVDKGRTLITVKNLSGFKAENGGLANPHQWSVSFQQRHFPGVGESFAQSRGYVLNHKPGQFATPELELAAVQEVLAQHAAEFVITREQVSGALLGGEVKDLQLAHS